MPITELTAPSLLLSQRFWDFSANYEFQFPLTFPGGSFPDVGPGTETLPPSNDQGPTIPVLGQVLSHPTSYLHRSSSFGSVFTRPFTGVPIGQHAVFSNLEPVNAEYQYTVAFSPWQQGFYVGILTALTQPTRTFVHTLYAYDGAGALLGQVAHTAVSNGVEAFQGIGLKSSLVNIARVVIEVSGGGGGTIGGVPVKAYGFLFTDMTWGRLTAPVEVSSASAFGGVL